jgi:hypothetical protein
MHRSLLLAALLVCAAPISDAHAAFSAPVELASGVYGVAAAADDEVTTSLVATGAPGGPRLIERVTGEPWQPGAPLPGAPDVAGPVVDAAGDRVLAIAWRVDDPRKYSGIAAAVRDPRGTLSEPIDIAGPEAGGVRHPTLAVDGAGDVLLAYTTGTRATHLNMRGAIAVAYRPAGGSFSTSVVVDREPSSAPVVALAPDGGGIVAWTRRGRLAAVSVESDGTIGTVKAFRSPAGVDGLVAAAGRGGAATLAWTSRRFVDAPPRLRARYYVGALRRAAGHAFSGAAVVARTSDYVRGTALSADEDGRVTLAWSEDHFGSDHKLGYNGITSAIRASRAAPGHDFGAPRTIASRGKAFRTPPVIAAAAGRVVLAWGYMAGRGHLGVQAAVGRAGRVGPAQAIATTTRVSGVITAAPAISASIDPTGAATVVFVEPGPVGPRLLAVEGSPSVTYPAPGTTP